MSLSTLSAEPWHQGAAVLLRWAGLFNIEAVERISEESLSENDLHSGNILEKRARIKRGGSKSWPGEAEQTEELQEEWTAKRLQHDQSKLLTGLISTQRVHYRSSLAGRPPSELTPAFVGEC